ncbi:MAG: hypothetical protein GTO60_16655 [Gammaproteobacteria bacterium]|nr:hypothetical protein [Gammaproteobacteria bacterium]
MPDMEALTELAGGDPVVLMTLVNLVMWATFFTIAAGFFFFIRWVIKRGNGANSNGNPATVIATAFSQTLATQSENNIRLIEETIKPIVDNNREIADNCTRTTNATVAVLDTNTQIQAGIGSMVIVYEQLAQQMTKFVNGMEVMQSDVHTIRQDVSEGKKTMSELGDRLGGIEQALQAMAPAMMELVDATKQIITNQTALAVGHQDHDNRAVTRDDIVNLMTEFRKFNTQMEQMNKLLSDLKSRDGEEPTS